MSHGARDYYFWDMPISVPNGGTGDTSLTMNGVLIGQGGNGIFVTAAGTPNQVLRVPGGGGAPVFSSLGALVDMATLDLSSAYVSNILPVAHGGTGTNTPGLTAGTGISIAWAWPGQLVTNTSAYAALADPLLVAHGGTGTTTPALIAGTGISITGVWPGQTITSTSNYAALADPLPVAHGGTGTTTPALVAGTAISITGTWPAQTINCTSAYATLADPLTVAHGGTGTTTPALVAGTGISITGTWPAQTITNSSAYATLADPLTVAHGGTGTTTPALVAGTGISISGTWPAQTITNTSAYATLADPLTVAHGGTGTTTPALVAGANISISGTWPAQTIALVASPSISYLSFTNPGNNIYFAADVGAGSHMALDQYANLIFPGSITGAHWWQIVDKAGTAVMKVFGDGSQVVSLATPLAVTSGGTGTGSPSLVAGGNIAISGTWPNQTVGFLTPTITLGAAGSNHDVTILIGNTSSPGFTQIGSTSFTASGIAGTLLGIANQGVAWLVAFDLSGNMGLAGTLKLGTPLAVTSGGTGASPASAGLILISSGSGAAGWTTPDGARVYNSANESIPTGSQTALTFDSERFNNGGIHSTVTNPSRLTCKTAGKYLITGHVIWAASAGGTVRTMSVRVNGSVYICGQPGTPATASSASSVATLWHLAVNDYVELVVLQDSGGALNVLAGADYSPEFAAEWLGP